MQNPLFLGAILAMAACNNASEVTSSNTGEQVETSTPNDLPSPTAAHDGEKTAAAPAQSAPAQFTSDYTSLAKANCEVVELDESGAGYVREQCGSFKGIPLFRTEGDLRQAAYAGNPPSSGQSTIAPFNYLGDMVEWRMQNGKPIALIYRVKADAPDMPDHGKSQLFVQKIGTGDDASCIIGLVAGGYPKANEKAREIADTAATHKCGDDGPMATFGDII